MTKICQRLFFFSVAAVSLARAQEIPARLADTTYWRMVSEMSEPSGMFPSDNLLSNEVSLQYVIPELVKSTKPGGVYVGVAPEQNFTYIAALKPKIAFMVDIRHDNSLLLLVYKALFELSADRVEFASRLFSRQRPVGLDTTISIEQLMQVFTTVPRDSALYVKNLAAVKDRLTKTHGFPLTAEDLTNIDYLYGWFYQAGPNLSYNMNGTFGGYGGRGRFPTYAMLMLETDGQGAHRSYLASEANFRVIKGMEEKNLILGVTGDFTGPKALRAVGNWIRDRKATITAFYVSNVEFYLFGNQGGWQKFYENVATLPVSEESQFIRSFSQGNGFRPGSPNGVQVELLCSIPLLLKEFQAGRISDYYEMIRLSK